MTQILVKIAAPAWMTAFYKKDWYLGVRWRLLQSDKPNITVAGGTT